VHRINRTTDYFALYRITPTEKMQNWRTRYSDASLEIFSVFRTVTRFSIGYNVFWKSQSKSILFNCFSGTMGLFIFTMVHIFVILCLGIFLFHSYVAHRVILPVLWTPQSRCIPVLDDHNSVRKDYIANPNIALSLLI